MLRSILKVSSSAVGVTKRSRVLPFKDPEAVTGRVSLPETKLPWPKTTPEFCMRLRFKLLEAKSARFKEIVPVMFRTDVPRGTPEAEDDVFTTLLPMITGPPDLTGAVPVVVLDVPLTVLLLVLMLPKATGWVDLLLL